MSQPPKIIYTALFVADTKLLLETFIPVHEKHYGHHSTIAYKPEGLGEVMVGRQRTLKVIGRVSDEKADALLVENELSDNEYPHITLSVAKGIEPAYSNKMLAIAEKNHIIELFNEPILIDVVEGYFNGEKDVIVQHTE